MGRKSEATAEVFSQRSGLLRKAADLATRLAHAFPSDGPKVRIRAASWRFSLWS